MYEPLSPQPTGDLKNKKSPLMARGGKWFVSIIYCI